MDFFQDSEKTDSYIARSIIDVAPSLKCEENKISISIALRKDTLNNKASELKNEEYAYRSIYIACQFNSSTTSR